MVFVEQNPLEKGAKDCVYVLNAVACHRETPCLLRRMEFMGGTDYVTVPP